MKHLWLNEDKRLPKLPVAFSNEIIENIDDINWDNRNNPDALFQWHEYIDGLVSYISDPVIAWDNMNRYKHSPNGETHIKEPAYDAIFMVKVNKTTNQSYVYVVNIDLRPDDYGLKNPSMIYEGKQLYKESVRKVISLVERMEKL